MVTPNQAAYQHHNRPKQNLYMWNFNIDNPQSAVAAARLRSSPSFNHPMCLANLCVRSKTGLMGAVEAKHSILSFFDFFAQSMHWVLIPITDALAHLCFCCLLKLVDSLSGCPKVKLQNEDLKAMKLNCLPCHLTCAPGHMISSEGGLFLSPPVG